MTICLKYIDSGPPPCADVWQLRSRAYQNNKLGRACSTCLAIVQVHVYGMKQRFLGINIVSERKKE